jgi:hypothetical protein
MPLIGEAQGDLLREADTYARVRDYLRHVRASRIRAGLPVAWQDAEQALWLHVLALRELIGKERA